MGSRQHVRDIKSGSPLPYKDDIRAYKKEYAEALDAQDPLRSFRDEFIIPSKNDLKRKTLAVDDSNEASDEKSIYFCGNSLGVQPRSTQKYIEQYLRTWATKGVTGHFVPHDDQLLPPFVDVDSAASKLMASVVGASQSEVAVMGTLTANLHLLMASFYRPTKEKYKIILEGKAFPSDHYAVESQLRHHNFDPKDGMVLIEPNDLDQPTLGTEQIIKVIDDNASSTALVLLSAIQFYTGQYFDMERITAHAHSKGILIGWDCAHAAGNVDLRLHDWNVDFAAWCNYKYLNSGPGGIAGLFVHERHGSVDEKQPESDGTFRPRLSGWWGGDIKTRFNMENKFLPQPGAAGFQLSNPSVLDINAVMASLEIFNRATMKEIRQKSLNITGYLEHLLMKYPLDAAPEDKPFTLITPSNPAERGAQLSLRLQPGLLDHVLHCLEDNGVVIDERKPDVMAGTEIKPPSVLHPESGQDANVEMRDGDLADVDYSVFTIFQGLSPMFIGDFADKAGRRPAYIVCFTIYIAANIGLALQNSYAALFVLRCLQSAGSSTTIALSSGVVADVATASQRGSYMGFVTAGSLMGPSVGPVIGGLLSQYLGWRAIFWFLTSFAAAFMVLFLVFFPETARGIVGDGSLPPQKWNLSLISYLKSRKAREEGVVSMAIASKQKLKFPNPLQTLAIVFQKDVSLILFCNAILFAGFYDVSASIPSIFNELYGLDDLQVGLCFIPFGLGATIASVVNGKLLDLNYRRLAQQMNFPLTKNRQTDLRNFPIEKARLQLAFPLLTLGSLSILVFGWFLNYGIHLAAPTCILFLMGLSLTGAFNTIGTLLVDLFPTQAAKATAANNFVRCLLGAGATALIDPMLSAMGRGWCFTFIALVMMATTPLLLVVIRKGPNWREERRLKEKAMNTGDGNASSQKGPRSCSSPR
ncbi:MFS transporter, putative [Penicillium digitatum PHI26]|uniref:Kynureninase n=3 Tax=Penicillium digitatum TaxID=36651 RepID=K9GJN0_PEND2|nr:MFS transporter, putative [Penicillium digitatum Pd1]EKV09462.1 MFS transporter, putative [Penicillium digitatum Pd1]EKV14908.1 MFS transporter, putative [Penicillium digitatum PHI26]